MLQLGTRLHVAEEKAAELPWQQITEARVSLAVAVVRDLIQEGRKNCFVCGFPGNFTEDFEMKEKLQYSKCTEKYDLDRTCKDKTMEAKLIHW